jgi:GntR family transcriptional regulator
VIELHLEPKAGISLYQQVVHQLTSAILGGRLTPGAQLPSVRELAKSTGVNALTVLKAYSALEQQKLIETRWGKGSFVAAAPPAPKSRAADAHLAELVDRFIAEALPLSPSPERLIELLRQRLARG